MDYSGLLKMYACKGCNTILAKEEDRITGDSFRGNYGTALLFHRLSGIEAGETFSKEMTTGHHLVRSVWCRQCKQEIGWLYVKAPRLSQEYKVGKYLVEAELLSTVMPKGGIAQAVAKL